MDALRLQAIRTPNQRIRCTSHNPKSSMLTETIEPSAKPQATATGHYSFNWIPDITGNYTVTQPSQAQQHTMAHTQKPPSLDAAAATAGATPAPPASMTDQYFLPSVAAIIIVIIVVGAMIILLQRKRQ